MKFVAKLSQNLSIRFALRTAILASVFLIHDLKAQEAAQKPEISEQEIRSDRVEFINRTNRRASPQARASELEIGADISRQVLVSGSGENDGIRIERLYNADEPGFGADVIFVTERADFGHVNAIQRVIRGYISKMYEYREDEANLLSRFVLYYNARLRGDATVLRAKYSKEVLGAISLDKVGIDRNYRNWSGNSQILIPLKKNLVRPGKMDMNDGELERESGDVPVSDKKKLDELQDNRKKEDLRKLDQREEVLKRQEEKLSEERQELKQQKQETQKEIVRTETQITELKKEPEKNREEIARTEQQKQQLDTKVQELDKKEEKVSGELEQIRGEKQEVAEQKQEIKSPAATQVTPEDGEMKRLADENRQLKDEQMRHEESSPNVIGEKILFMRVLGFTEESHYRSELWAIDTKNDDALLRSPYVNICGRDFTVIPDQGILVIGYPGEPDHNSEHHLVLLDPESLTVKASGSEVVFWRTPVKWMDGRIYVVEAFNNQYHLTRFNPDLKMEARSSEPVSPNSEITFTKDKIYLTGKKIGTDSTLITVFNRANLSHIKTFEPVETKSGASR